MSIEQPVTLRIKGMSCGHCAGTVKAALSKVPGVTRAEIDLDNARAMVEGTASIEALTAAVIAAGYGVRQP